MGAHSKALAVSYRSDTTCGFECYSEAWRYVDIITELCCEVYVEALRRASPHHHTTAQRGPVVGHLRPWIEQNARRVNAEPFKGLSKTVFRYSTTRIRETVNFVYNQADNFRVPGRMCSWPESDSQIRFPTTGVFYSNNREF